VVFGDDLANNASFVKVMHDYTTNMIPCAFALRFLNLGPLRHIILYFVHWRHRRKLETAIQFVTGVMDERGRAQTPAVAEDEKPFDCIQWALDQPVPEDEKTPEILARRLLTVSGGAVASLEIALLHLLYDLSVHKECVPDLREEIRLCLAEEDGAWSQTSMAKMKKLDSFLQECFRVNAFASPRK
jgi:hypothetical protein